MSYAEEKSNELVVKTPDDAIAWVNSYRQYIISRALEYVKHTPYDTEDYVQDAYNAAVSAVRACQQNPKLQFKGTFWAFFGRYIAMNTPLNEDFQKNTLMNKAAECLKNTPYDTEEYMQIAYKAAVSADRDCKKNSRLKFRDVFWTYFSKQLPLSAQSNDSNEPETPRKSGYACMSFSSSSRADVDMTFFESTKHQKVDIEGLIDKYGIKWSPREQSIMALALGTTEKGRLSPKEIAEETGLKRDTVREYMQRALKKVADIAQAKAA